MSELLQYLSRTVSLPNEQGMSDGELLDRFVARRDQAAFAALVRRHGQMVWSVCRRLLVHHDAEDAFQATFIVLVRKADSVRPSHRVGNWLYGVAYQTALNTRAAAIRRRARERQASPTPEPAEKGKENQRELRAILDQELNRLPPRYRAAIVLCDLEGRTRKEVAHELRVPEGTLSGFLTRGRAMLGKRLERQGLVLSAGALAELLVQETASAAVPGSMLLAAVNTGGLSQAGSTAGASLLLAETTIHAMSLAKVKLALALGVVLCIGGAGVGWVARLVENRTPQGASAPNEPVKTAAARRRERNNLADFTLGKATTYITEPILPDGGIDYERALNEQLGKGITAKSNAFALLWQSLGPQAEGRPVLPEFFQRLGIDPPPERGPYFVDAASFARETLQLAPEAEQRFREQVQQTARALWREGDYPQVARWLAANQDCLNVIIEATKRPDAYYPLVSRKTAPEGNYGLVGAQLLGVQSFREEGQALIRRALLRAGEGKYDDAWQDLLACHRLGRLVAQEAGPTVFRVGIAIDQAARDATLLLIASAKPNGRQTRAWLDDLQHLPPSPSIADWFDRGGRFMFLDTVMHIRRDGIAFLQLLVKIEERPGKKPAELEQRQSLGALLNYDAILRAGNGWYDRMAAAYRLADRSAREKEFQRIEDDVKRLEQESGSIMDLIEDLRQKKGTKAEWSKRLTGCLIGFYLQDLEHVRIPADRAEQTSRNQQLAFALVAYHAVRGSYPKDLKELAPEYLAWIPDDIFCAKELHYQASKDEFLLYSVGVNGIDEGGRTAKDTPAGDDLAVRIAWPVKPGATR
jgi:RNA polymerase sigma factor (sigma-70 family)